MARNVKPVDPDTTDHDRRIMAPPTDRPGRGAHQVGVRALRQNLSVYLRRVKSGEALEVLERGHVVAFLVPLRPASSTIDRLVAAGRAAPARGRLDALPAPTGTISHDLSAALADVREERL